MVFCFVCSGLVVFFSALVVFCSAVLVFCFVCSGLVVFYSALVVFCSTMVVFCFVCSGLVVICSAVVVFCSGLVVFCSALMVFCSGLVVFCSALVGSSHVCSALVGFYPICSALVGFYPVCSALVGFCPVCSTLVGSCSVCSTLVGPCSVGPVLASGSTLAPSSVAFTLVFCSALVLCPASSASVPLLPFTPHQRSLAHHIDSCTTLTVARHPRLQFLSSIALMTHTADCTDHRAESHHTPYLSCGLPQSDRRVLSSAGVNNLRHACQQWHAEG